MVYNVRWANLKKDFHFPYHLHIISWIREDGRKIKLFFEIEQHLLKILKFTKLKCFYAFSAEKGVAFCPLNFSNSYINKCFSSLRANGMDGIDFVHFVLLPKLFWPTMRKNCSSDREITRTIYSNSERAEQFLVTECFFNLFLEVSQISKNRTIIIQNGKNYWDLEICSKS